MKVERVFYFMNYEKEVPMQTGKKEQAHISEATTIANNLIHTFPHGERVEMMAHMKRLLIDNFSKEIEDAKNRLDNMHKLREELSAS